MTTEIESLVKDIDACIADRDAMIQKRAELKLKSAQTVLENYENFFFPEADELHKILRNFGGKRVYVNLKEHLIYKIGEREFVLSPNSDYFSFLLRDNACAFGWRYTPQEILNSLTSIVDNIKNEGTAIFELLLTFFGTEDSTLKVLDFYRDAVVKALQSMNDNICESNNALSELLDKMQNILSNTHSVTEKEDGTIELQIGGKTYVGTVKEQ